MKAEFYYNKRKYTCGIFKTELVKELRIRNEEGEVLAIEKGKRIGFQGKRRETSKKVDVSQPYFYNLVKAATVALEIAEKNQLIIEKERVIDVKDEQINILSQQLSILSQSHTLSFEQRQKLHQLQENMREQVVIIEEQKQHIAKLEDDLKQPLRTLSLKNIEKKIIAKLGDSIWKDLPVSSQRDLCSAYRNYNLIKLEEFTASVANYSNAGHPLGLVAEREIVAPFFKGLYHFLSISNNQVNLSGNTFRVGGVSISSTGEYKLGDLPALLAPQWDNFINNALNQEEAISKKCLYRSVFCNGVSQADRQLINQFLLQWQHPSSKWLAKGQVAASMIDQIRQLRNRASHAEPILYFWQFKMLWSLLVGRKTGGGVLQEIYGDSNIVKQSGATSDKNRNGPLITLVPSSIVR